jgi:hypothetical protein
VEIIDRHLGIKKAIMTTIHAYTSSQAIVDGPAKKFARGRAGAANFVPTSTGAAKATTDILPHLKGRFDGVAVRGPVPCGSMADIVMVLEKATTAQEVNDILRKEAETPRYKGIMGVAEDPLVSSDVIKIRLPGLGGGTQHDPGGGRRPPQDHDLVRQRMGLHQPDGPGSGAAAGGLISRPPLRSSLRLGDVIRNHVKARGSNELAPLDPLAY